MRAAEKQTAEPAKGSLRRGWALLGIVVGLLAVLLLQIAQVYPEQTERLYAREFYPALRSLLSAVAARSPVSLAELLLALFALWCLWLLWRAARAYLGQRRGLWSLLYAGLLRCLGLLGWGYAAFLIAWGFNHARLPYAALTGLDVESSSEQSEELAALLEHLVAECNRLRPELLLDDLHLLGEGGAADPRLLHGFQVLSRSVIELAGPAPVLRLPLVSPLLSRLGITGIYSPFTAEAHLNSEVPLWSQPFSACHEVAHERGFAREDEANFIAWQVCRASGDAAFAYSGTYAALCYVSHALLRLDPQRTMELLGALENSVLEDQRQSDAFWESRQSVLTEISNSSNDVFLQAQGQRAGVQSYGRMVGLLLAERRRNAAQSGAPGRLGGD